MQQPLAILTADRDWPWRDGDLLGWPGLVAIAALLVLVTLWTYAGQRQIGWRKVFTVLALRLAALAIIALLLLRPSFANEQEVVTPGKLIIVLDSSLSMKINDAPNSSSRWDFVRKLLDWPDVKDALQRLQKDKQIEIVVYQAAENVQKYNPASDADGKRTDIGKWLNRLWEIHHSDRNLRGLLLITDGADNGTSYPVLSEAAKWRELPCPIQTFGAGSEATRQGQKDIAVVDVKAKKELIYVNNKVPVEATIDAPNLEGQHVTVRLFVDGKQVSVKENVKLPNARGNVIDAGEFVPGPEQAGEIKVTVKIDPVPGEFTILNNEMSTYINVRKEGITILWIDRPRREEATGILRALNKDARFSITYDERVGDGPLGPAQAEFFKSPDKAFDVVVIGDISAAQFSGGSAGVFEKLAEQVATKRTGLLMLGGYQTFGNGGWNQAGKRIADLLPVGLTSDQVEDKTLVVPVSTNAGHRLIQLDAPANKDLWRDVFKPLDGYAKLGAVKANNMTLLQTDESREPIFVVTPDGSPRVAVFAGDTTWVHSNWYGSDDAVRAFERFWNQLVAWLARQEEGSTQVWIKLDKRRISVGANQKIGFSVGANGKDGLAITNATYIVKVTGPGGETSDIGTALKVGEQRGEFKQTNMVGEYKVSVSATVGDISLGTASARFMGYAEDVENQQPAANHKDLIKLAAAGGGSFRIAGKEELLQYLSELRDRSGGSGWVKRDVWPNWKTPPASDAVGDQVGALVQSLALPCLLLFAGCLGTEWFLRRWWGLV
ncbi:MAG TPA: hypothetical protein VE988_03085 [Gemmataceae bacterium]|nr:hypothetical protein [Gemmataceae bacterium]